MTLDSETGQKMKTVLLKLARLNLVLCLTAAGGFTAGSVGVRSESMTQSRPTGCEYNTAILDGLAQKTKPNELIIVMAHLGPKDMKPNLNSRRLHNVSAYLTEVLTDPTVRRRPETIVLAQGDRAQDYGSVEFYVNGKLFDTLKIRANADLSVGNCGWEPPQNPCPTATRNLFPCKDRYRR
jgi:hypothetical protein